MIRWIQSRQWLSSVLLATIAFLVFGGFDFVFFASNALLVSLLLSLALLFLARLFYVSLTLLVAALALGLWFNLGLTVSSLGLIVLVFLGATAKGRFRRFSVLSVSALGLLALLKNHNPATTLSDSSLVFWLCFALIVVSIGAAYFLGRLTITRFVHVGTPLDQKIATRESANLALRLAEQEERFQIAREISEVILQDITAVLTQAEGGAYAAKVDPSAATRVLDRIAINARSAHQELRRLYDQLNRNLGIQAAPPGIDDLEQQVQELREAGYSATLKHSGHRFEISEGASLAIYRLVFDSLENVKDHAPAGSSVSIDFTWVEDGMQVLVKDNGIETLNRETVRRAEKAGESSDVSYSALDDLEALTRPIIGPSITAMRERAALYGGAIEATKVPGVGFTVSAIFPQLRLIASPSQER